MKINEIIREGDAQNGEQLAKATGGTGINATNTNSQECKCESNPQDENANMGKGCVCTPAPGGINGDHSNSTGSNC